VLPAPLDAEIDDVEPVVAALRAQVLRERNGHAADAAADVEDAVVGLQAADVDEVLQELVADLAETAAADEVQLVGRNHLVKHRRPLPWRSAQPNGTGGVEGSVDLENRQEGLEPAR